MRRIRSKSARGWATLTVIAWAGLLGQVSCGEPPNYRLRRWMQSDNAVKNVRWAVWRIAQAYGCRVTSVTEVLRLEPEVDPYDGWHNPVGIVFLPRWGVRVVSRGKDGQLLTRDDTSTFESCRGGLCDRPLCRDTVLHPGVVAPGVGAKKQTKLKE